MCGCFGKPWSLGNEEDGDGVVRFTFYLLLVGVRRRFGCSFSFCFGGVCSTDITY